MPFVYDELRKLIQARMASERPDHTLRPAPFPPSPLGTTTCAAHEALCQSNPSRLGGEPILNLFPAWPKNWNAQFTLPARGRFLVAASWADGEPESVEILSRGGRSCRIRNPWPAAKPITIYRNGTAWKTVENALLTFDTQPNGRYLLVPSDATPEKLPRVVPVKQRTRDNNAGATTLVWETTI